MSRRISPLTVTSPRWRGSPTNAISTATFRENNVSRHAPTQTLALASKSATASFPATRSSSAALGVSCSTSDSEVSVLTRGTDRVEAPNNCPNLKRDTTYVVNDFQIEVARDATVALNHCISCKLAIDDCRKACATPGACGEAYRCKMNHSMWQCNECKISCDCGHACPQGSLAARAKEMLDVMMRF